MFFVVNIVSSKIEKFQYSLIFVNTIVTFY